MRSLAAKCLPATVLIFLLTPALSLGPAHGQLPRQIESLDEVFAEVARRVPGFGGMFIGVDGMLRVYLLDVTQGANVEIEIIDVFGRDRLPGGSSLIRLPYDSAYQASPAIQCGLRLLSFSIGKRLMEQYKGFWISGEAKLIHPFNLEVYPEATVYKQGGGSSIFQVGAIKAMECRAEMRSLWVACA
jgi:hypothetical protein